MRIVELMDNTSNPLAPKTKTTVNELLQQALFDSIELMAQAKVAHWNVKGPNFIGLHELLDEVAGRFAEYADEIAERQVQLGGRPKGTSRQVAKETDIADLAPTLDWKENVQALVKSMAKFSKQLLDSIEKAGEAGDPASEDLFTEVLRGVDKDIWFLEAHLQS